MIKNQRNKIVFKFRLNEEENKKLERCAMLCELSQTEFIRQLCQGKTPQPQPAKEFWELLNSLYDLHDAFGKCVPYLPEISNECRKIEQLVLLLQEAV